MMQTENCFINYFSLATLADIFKNEKITIYSILIIQKNQIKCKFMKYIIVYLCVMGLLICFVNIYKRFIMDEIIIKNIIPRK